MADINIPRGTNIPGIIPDANIGNPETREKVLAAQSTISSDTTAYLEGIQNKTEAEIGNRPDPNTSNDIEEVQYTLRNWTSNGAKLMQDTGDAFNTISQDPTGFFNSLKNATGNSFEALKNFSETALKNMGMTPEQIAQGGGIELLKLPTLAGLSALELMGSVIADWDKVQRGEIDFEKLKQNFENRQRAVTEKLAKQVPSLASLVGGSEGALKFAGSLLKSISDSMGLTDVWDGISTGDFSKIGEGLRKFAAEATGWQSMVNAWDCLKKGDAAGFAINFTMGVGAMAMTASSVLTLGGSTVALLGTKAVVKGAMTTVTREGMEIVAKEAGEKVTQTLANELKEILIKEVPQEMAEKAPQELLEHVFKQSGEEMFAGFKEGLRSNLKNPEVLKKYGLSDDVLEKMQKGALDEVTKGKLDTLIKETSKEATLKQTNQLIEKLQLAQKLPDVTDRVVTELLNDLSTMSKKDLGEMFTKVLESQGHAPKEAAKLAKEYAWRVKSAVTGEKVDGEIIELLTNSIHKEFTAPIRESFEASLKKGMPQILEDLNVHENLRPELTGRWSRAAMEGFEEGLQPIKSLIREGVERAVKRHRDRDDDQAASNFELIKQASRKEEGGGFPGKRKTPKVIENTTVKPGSTKNQEVTRDDDFWRKQAAEIKEKDLKQQRQQLEKIYQNAGGTPASRSPNSLEFAGKTNSTSVPPATTEIEKYQQELTASSAPEELPLIFKS